MGRVTPACLGARHRGMSPWRGGGDRAPRRQRSCSGAAVCCLRVLVSGRGLHASQGALSGGVRALSSGVPRAQLSVPPPSPAAQLPALSQDPRPGVQVHGRDRDTVLIHQGAEC